MFKQLLILSLFRDLIQHEITMHKNLRYGFNRWRNVHTFRYTNSDYRKSKRRIHNSNHLHTNCSAWSTPINAGALSISVSNVGTDAAQFSGASLPSGATINISIPNAVLPKYTYNALTSSLMILDNR